MTMSTILIRSEDQSDNGKLWKQSHVLAVRSRHRVNELATNSGMVGPDWRVTVFNLHL